MRLLFLTFAWLLLGAALVPARDPRVSARFLMEDDLVYARFLALARDGTYRQINRDHGTSAQVDRGTWKTLRDGSLQLQSSQRALQPRALAAGPLSVVLTSDLARGNEPKLLASIRHFLGESADMVFDRSAALEINAAAGLPIQVDPDAATFSRADLQNLADQLTTEMLAEKTGTDVLNVVPNSRPARFILFSNPFRAEDYARVIAKYRVPKDGMAPFYFTEVSAARFSQEVGEYREPGLPGRAE